MGFIQSRRRAVRSLGAVLALATMGAGQAAASPFTASPGPHARPGASVTYVTNGPVRLIVQAPGSGAAAAAAAVERLGGLVTRDLDLVDGVAATVPAAAAARLARTPGLSVTPDRPVHVQGEVGPAPAGTSVFRDVVGATELNGAGNRGEGVTVAVIDTGIADVADLAGRVVTVRDDVRNTTAPCVNLSGEAGCADSYGHGTFMAGLIAGSGASSDGRFAGVAPAARLVSVKVAGRDGSSDVSTILSALQWVVSFKDRYDIRVLNLSLGTDSTQSYRTDPLNSAVERAWAAGITVVVAASNRGPEPRTISKPGDDPWVITVGAIDDRGTADLGDDHLPDFSARGPTAADGLPKPDVAAPGAHVVSLAAPGSDIATKFPSAIGGGYQVGNGTSMATAVVSGAAALLVKAKPTITPDQLKYALSVSARPGAVPEPAAVGAGVISAVGASTAPPGTANQNLARSSGKGSLDASRGTVRVRTSGPTGVVVSVQMTQQLIAWDRLSFLSGTWTEATWYSSPSYLMTWKAVTWEGSKWQGSKWQGSKWQGSKWQGGAEPTSAYGRKWQGADWYGAWD